MKQQPISIIGGGIAGLTTALQLAQFGIQSQVFEQAHEFSEIGAGLQLSPNASRRLFQLGLKDALYDKAFEPNGLAIYQLSNNKPIRHFPFKGRMREHYGAPYLVCKRASLHKILLNQCRTHDHISLHTDHQLQTIKPKSEQAELTFANGAKVTTSMIIGADGLWSNCRANIISSQTPRLTKYSAWRALIPLAQAPDFLRTGNVSIWLGKQLHLVIYQINRTELNLVAISNRDPNHSHTEWDRKVDHESFVAAMPPMANELASLFDHIKEIGVWNLFDLAPLPNWSDRHLTLIGDAAHPILPFMAQGAAIAIEDGVSLATLIAQKTPALTKEQIATKFMQEREPRVKTIAKRSKSNGRIYHSGFAMATLRNFALRHMSEDMFFKTYDEIYRG